MGSNLERKSCEFAHQIWFVFFHVVNVQITPYVGLSLVMSDCYEKTNYTHMFGNMNMIRHNSFLKGFFFLCFEKGCTHRAPVAYTLFEPRFWPYDLLSCPVEWTKRKSLAASSFHTFLQYPPHNSCGHCVKFMSAANCSPFCVLFIANHKHKSI